MSTKLVDSYINDIAKRLHDPGQFGAASVMIGAGFSKNAISLSDNEASPDWQQLAEKMYRSLYPEPKDSADKELWNKNLIKKTSGKNVLKLAEEYKVVFGRNKLDRFIEESINDDKYIPGKLHKDLLELNWKDVFTTNYDTLLEKATSSISVRKNYKILASQNDLPGSTHPRIIKLHGSISDARPYIICEEDYRTYPVKYAPFVNTVQQSMLETQLCLLGFSGDDPNFLSWLGWLRDNMGENCPQIYLCGIFNGMSESEKKLLENQNIAVVNLDCLIDDKSGNSHYDAIETFLKKLKSYGEEPDIFKSMPYSNVIIADKIDEKYYDKMIEYIRKAKQEASKYPILPLKELEAFSERIYDHFKHVARRPVDMSKLVLMGNFLYLLKKTCMPLYDYEADKLEELIKVFSFESVSHNTEYKGIWFDISMSLAEMYRIDANFEKYEAVMEKVESIFLSLDINQKNEVYIEKAKFSISQFDYIKSLDYAKKIDENVSYETQIKKAFILSQIGENKDAHELLGKCSASLAQKLYSEDKSAALVSYMNLCARSLKNYRILDNFSDKEFINNKYNVRNIFNDLKSSLSDKILHAESKNDKVTHSFNPNSYTYSYGISSGATTNLIEESFRYLLLQDRLCLPFEYSDHKDIVSRAIQEVLPTSKSPLWKWSCIVRVNDENLIKNFFTKELIVNSDISFVESLFDQLTLLIENFSENESYDGLKKVATLKIAYKVLSRLCVVLDTERITEILTKLLRLFSDKRYSSEKSLHSIMNRLSYCFNSEILKEVFVKILEIPEASTPIATYFFNIEAENIDVDISDDLILRVIDEVSDKDIQVRDNGISKIILMKNCKKELSKHHTSISEAIWGKTDKNGFLKANKFSIFIWESLPHPSDVSFKSLYADYLRKPSFKRPVELMDRTINRIIRNFSNNVYTLSSFQENNHYGVVWNSELINLILKYINGHLENEKEFIKNIRVEFDLFGDKKSAEERLIHLADLVAILITQAKISKVYDEVNRDTLNNIKLLFEETRTSILSIELIENLNNDNIEGIYQRIVKQILSGEFEEVTQAFLTLDILILYKEHIDDKIDFENYLMELLKSLKYMDIAKGRLALLCLNQIINRKVLLEEKFRKEIISSFIDCFDIYEVAIQGENKNYLDAIFNLSKLSKKYHETLIENDIEVPQKMKLLIDKLINSPLNEVRNIWEGYPEKQME